MRCRSLGVFSVVIALSVMLSGCASLYQGARFEDFNRQLVQGQVTEATTQAVDHADIDQASGQPDNLLWTLQAGGLLRMEKQYQRSNQFLDAAEQLIYQDNTRNIALSSLGQGGSLLYNDTALPYAPSHYDGIMANTYKAMNFSALYKPELARVEWNRVDDRQRRAVDDFARQISRQREELAEERSQNETRGADLNASYSYSQQMLKDSGINMSRWQPYKGYVNPFATYMHGLFFLLNAQMASDYDRAYQSFERAYSMTGNPTAKADMELANELRQGFSLSKVRPRVWVLFENGLAAHKQEWRIDLPVVLSHSNILYTGIALPRLVDGQQAWQALSVSGGGGTTKTQAVGDMDRIIKAEFKEAFPTILMKELVRATAKTLVQQRAQERAQKDYGQEESPLALAMALYQVATTSADIRSWTALPKEFQVARIRRPDNGVVVINAVDNNSAGYQKPIRVSIDANSQFNIIYVKAISRQAQPSVEVISL